MPSTALCGLLAPPRPPRTGVSSRYYTPTFSVVYKDRHVKTKRDRAFLRVGLFRERHEPELGVEGNVECTLPAAAYAECSITSQLMKTCGRESPVTSENWTNNCSER